MYSQNKKYVVIGGTVQSKHDGDLHYVNAITLCRLYKVSIPDCYLLERNDPNFRIKRSMAPTDLPVLEPRFDGDYKHPSKYK